MATILVCEDNPDICEMVVFILKGEGYTVAATPRGRDVAKLVAERRPDLLLLDLRIPDMDGYEVLSALRASADPAVPPVLVLSAKTSPEDRALALSLGAREFLEKPFTLDGLTGAVRRCLRPVGGEAAPTVLREPSA